VLKNRIFAFLTKYYSGDQIKEDVVCRAWSTNGGEENA